jgi:hypothetical protein
MATEQKRRPIVIVPAGDHVEDVLVYLLYTGIFWAPNSFKWVNGYSAAAILLFWCLGGLCLIGRDIGVIIFMFSAQLSVAKFTFVNETMSLTELFAAALLYVAITCSFAFVFRRWIIRIKSLS